MVCFAALQRAHKPRDDFLGQRAHTGALSNTSRYLDVTVECNNGHAGNEDGNGKPTGLDSGIL